jgi:hypothetical protein
MSGNEYISVNEETFEPLNDGNTGESNENTNERTGEEN